MKPIEAIHSLSAFISYQDDKKNGVRLYLIQQITRALIGSYPTEKCKQLLKEKADIDIEFDVDVVDVKPVDYCGFKGQICRQKKKKILSINSHVTEFGSN